MKNKVKRVILTIWVMLALLALGGGLTVFLQDLSFTGYLEWGGACAAVCIVHLIYDFCTKDRSWDFWVILVYFALSVLLGPILTVLFILQALGFLLTSKGKEKRNGKRGAESASAEPTDQRKQDFAVFNDAMERAIANVVSSSSNYPDGRYVRVARRDVQSTTTKAFGIRIYGSVTYEARHVGPERSPEEYKQDIVDCMTRTQENLLNAARRAAESVQRNYRGFDNEWEIEVRLKPEVK